MNQPGFCTVVLNCFLQEQRFLSGERCLGFPREQAGGESRGQLDRALGDGIGAVSAGCRIGDLINHSCIGVSRDTACGNV